ncbi:bacteriocin biosynthesis protein SagD [Halobacteriales archaeon QH_7_65_31]|nr:MAG: bacteriocin biosynthesis protein SagD [Halobacteriales archaeon QH_7_65_31]
MHVGLVGSGHAATAVRQTLADTVSSVTEIDPRALGSVDLAVAVGPVGAAGFETVGDTARETGTPWLAVELGGVGGYALDDVDAAVSGFAPGEGCFDCLRARVAANGGETGRTQTSDADARLAGTIAGRAVARLADGGESAALGGVIELPYTTRRLLPVPGCVCASAREYGLDREHAPRDLDGALAAAEQAVDSRIGLVPEVGEAESFPAPYYLATLADTTGFSDAQAGRQAAGVATDWNRAYMKAIGEGLERYAAGVYREAEFDRSPPSELPDGVVPSAFVCSPAFGGPDPERSIRWYPGEHLDTGARVRLPAEFVQFPPPETHYRPSITTGLGVGNGGVEALCSGLYEVIERDAAMIAWYSTFEPLGLAVGSERYREIERRASAESLSATALLVTQDVDVPVVVACLHRESGEWPRFAAGMSAGLDPNVAAADALEEALQNWLELRGMGKSAATDQSGAIGSYAELPPTAREFVAPETTIPADSVGPDEPPTGADELEALVARVTDAGLDPYGARLTPRDLERQGFEAVRVLVPTAQPLFTDEPYFGDRAEDVPEELGFEPRLDRDHHPYP